MPPTNYTAREASPWVTRRGPDILPPAPWGEHPPRPGSGGQGLLIKKPLLTGGGACREPLERCPGLAALELSSDAHLIHAAASERDTVTPMALMGRLSARKVKGLT